MSDIVERLTSLTIGDKTFEVEYYLGGGDPLHGALTTEENIHIDQSQKKYYNVSHSPLFPMIPLVRVVVDNLHLFLQVAYTESIFSLQSYDIMMRLTKCIGFTASIGAKRHI